MASLLSRTVFTGTLTGSDIFYGITDPGGTPAEWKIPLSKLTALYATAAQGVTADSAVQPGDLATVATSGAYGDLSGTPTIGTLAALNSPLPIANGGTAGTTAGDARTNWGLGTIATQAANNVSISGGSISGITDLAIADGGTGQSTAQAAIDALTAVAAATNEHVLTKDTVTGNAVFKAAAGGSSLPVVDETAIVYKTGNVAITQTHDINAYTVARTVTWPDAAMTVAGLQVANVFTAIQKVNVNNALALLVEQDGVRDNVFVVDTANGRVGVNTVPSVAFHVAETMYLTSAASNPILELRGAGASSICLIDFSQGGTDYDGRIMLFSDGTFRIVQNDNNELQFLTSNTQRMRIGGAGHVAINKAVDTSYFLDVSGTARATTLNATTSIVINDGTITKLSGNYFDWTTGIRLDAVGGRQLMLGNTVVNTGNDYSIVSASKFSIYTNGYGVEAMRILTDGRVGINDTTPDGQLDVVQSSTTAAIPALKLEQADLSEEFIRFDTTVGTGNPTEAVGAKTLTTTHFIRVYIEGVGARYMPVGTIA